MLSVDYINDKYRAIKQKIDAEYMAYNNIWTIWQNEALIDTRLEAGDVSLLADLNASLPNNNISSWYFNHTRPMISMVSGFQRRNRKSTVVVPLENADQDTSDQWTKIIANIYKREHIYETISDAFYQGAGITGLNLLHAYIDYSTDPLNGDVRVDNLSFNSFYIDPYFRKHDLSDCKFIRRRSYVTHSEAGALLPDHYDAIMRLQGSPNGSSPDAQFQYMPEAYGMGRANLLAYDEYYYRDTRTQITMIDNDTMETFEVTTQDPEEIERVMSQSPSLELKKNIIPTIRLAVMVQDKVFYDGPSGLDIYPFVPVMGFYNPMMPNVYTRIQGLCRSLRDPQMLLNRRIILSMDAAESTVNTGFIFKESAVIDPNHLMQTGQGRIIPLKDEAQMTDIQQIIPPNIPQTWFDLQETCSKEMNAVTGINEELLGSAIDDKAALLSAYRQGAGLTTLQPLFDRLDFSQNMLGNLVMELVRTNYGPGKIKNLLEGAQPAPLFYNKAFGKYNCMVEAGFNTESQKQMEFAQLVQLRELGIQIPDSVLLDCATIQNKTKIIDMMQQATQQQNQIQQSQMQQQSQLVQAQINATQATAAAQYGLGVERQSRVYENQGLGEERRAAAMRDEQQAVLNLAKALNELEHADVDQMYKVVQTQQLLKNMERVSFEENKYQNQIPMQYQNQQQGYQGNPRNLAERYRYA